MFTRERLTRWTAALRANPEQQQQHRLANSEYTKFCCLGKLCEIEGLARARGGYYTDTGYIKLSYLPPTLAEAFGDKAGNFTFLAMPGLQHNFQMYSSAAAANDDGVPWPVIADHFDKYYPCSDEQQEIN